MSVINRTSTAFVSDAQVASNPCSLYGFSVYNSSASAQFIQLHDTISVPVDGTAPTMFYSVPPNSGREFYFGEKGRPFYQGLYICASSTHSTKTLGTANFWLDVQFMILSIK